MTLQRREARSDDSMHSCGACLVGQHASKRKLPGIATPVQENTCSLAVTGSCHAPAGNDEASNLDNVKKHLARSGVMAPRASPRTAVFALGKHICIEL